MSFFDNHELHPFFQKNPNARKRFIGLVGCGKAKANYAMQAKKLYIGGLTRMSIEWMDRNCETFFILSAKCHLTPSDKIIDPYDLKMDDLDKNDQLAWGQVVAKQLTDSVGTDKLFVVMAGASYINALTLGCSEHLKIYNPCRGLTMGLRMSWIRTHPVMSKSVFDEIKARGT